MFPVPRRFQLLSILFGHARHLTTAGFSAPPLPPPRPESPFSAAHPARQPTRDPRVLSASHPDRDVLLALQPHVAPGYHLSRLARLSLARPALEIITSHRLLTDADILRFLARSDSHSLPGPALTRIVEAVVGTSAQTHAYDTALIVHLAQLALDHGSPTAARYLLSPVRGTTVLLPDRDARLVYDRLLSSHPSLAWIYWSERIAFQLARIPPREDDDPDDKDRRQTLAKSYQHLLSSAYQDSHASPTVRTWAALSLGTAHAQGTILSFSGAAAEEWWLLAVDAAPHSHASARAAWYLANVYLGRPIPGLRLGGEGPLFAPSRKQGIRYLYAASRFFPQAAAELGERYYLDPQKRTSAARQAYLVQRAVVKPDDVKAATYFFQAAIGGHTNSRIKFAEMLLYGKAWPHVPFDRSDHADGHGERYDAEEDYAGLYSVDDEEVNRRPEGPPHFNGEYVHLYSPSSSGEGEGPAEGLTPTGTSLRPSPTLSASEQVETPAADKPAHNDDSLLPSTPISASSSSSASATDYDLQPSLSSSAPTITFSPRSRLDTLLYAASFLSPLTLPIPRSPLPRSLLLPPLQSALDPALVPRNSVLWELPRLIESVRRMRPEEAERMEVEPPRVRVGKERARGRGRRTVREVGEEPLKGVLPAFAVPEHLLGARGVAGDTFDPTPSLSPQERVANERGTWTSAIKQTGREEAKEGERVEEEEEGTSFGLLPPSGRSPLSRLSRRAPFPSYLPVPKTAEQEAMLSAFVDESPARDKRDSQNWAVRRHAGRGSFR